MSCAVSFPGLIPRPGNESVSCYHECLIVSCSACVCLPVSNDLGMVGAGDETKFPNTALLIGCYTSEE